MKKLIQTIIGSVLLVFTLLTMSVGSIGVVKASTPIISPTSSISELGTVMRPPLIQEPPAPFDFSIYDEKYTAEAEAAEAKNKAAKVAEAEAETIASTTANTNSVDATPPNPYLDNKNENYQDPAKWKTTTETGLEKSGLAVGDAQSALVGWINFALSFVSVIAALMIIIGGYWYITGEEEGKKKGQQWIINAIMGIVLILSAWVIVNTFLS